MLKSAPLIRTMPEPLEAFTSASLISFVPASYVAVMTESPGLTTLTGRSIVRETRPWR